MLVICDAGGQACLDEYINVEYYEEIIYQIDGEAYYFWVFTNQTVTTEHGVDVICTTGGKDCLNDYVYTNLVPSGVALFKNGVEMKNEIRTTGRMVWMFAALVFILALYVCLTLYKKQQTATEKR
mmetsp:Transcript_7522/g.6851  ORF Transcript_7522/g.6851 Transcript_7522/m.6851 type:complete len:125 (-) Transcript_7522:119-493(-)